MLDLAEQANLPRQVKARSAGRNFKVKEFFGD